MSGVQWNLGLQRGPSVGEQFQRGMTQGATREIMAGRGGPRQWNALYQHAPEMAMRLEDREHQRGERARTSEYRNALADYIIAGGGGMPATSQNALAPAPMPSMPIGNGKTPVSARERAIRANPEGFITQDRGLGQLSREQFQLVREVHNFNMQILGGVTDQATYDQARAAARAEYQQRGLPTDFIDNLPAQWSPGLQRQLLSQGMDTQRQLAAMDRRDRLDWDIEDDMIDNEALAEHRAGTRENVRRGQDIRSGDTRRGQDVTDRRGRRGQDLQDRRFREGITAPSGGRPGRANRRPAAGRAEPLGGAGRRRVRDSSGAEVEAEVRNGQWVNAATGQPL